MDAMKALGEMVKKGREAKGMRGIDLAFAIKRDASYVSRLERGTLKEIPDPETLRMLSEAIGVRESRLLEAIGYRVKEEQPDALPYDSERATVIALAPTLKESDAFVVRHTIQALIKSREAQQVAEREEVLSLA